MLLSVNTRDFFTENFFSDDFEHDKLNNTIITIKKASSNCIISLVNQSNVTNDFAKINYDGVNLEIPMTKEMLQFVLKTKPHACYITSEKMTGLNVAGQLAKMISFVGPLFLSGVNPILSIAPEFEQIEAAANTGVKVVELVASDYSTCFGTETEEMEFQKLKKAAEFAQTLNLTVNIGHGLNYENVKRICEIQNVHELNISGSIALRAKSVGLEAAILEMKALID